MLHTKIIHIFMLVIIVSLCYANIIDGPFLWDDETLIVHNTAIRDFRNIPSFFAFGAWPTEFAVFYRPFQLITYTLDYSFWQLDPRGYHVVNILLHLLNVVLVYYLLYLVLGHRTASFMGSILFAVHPLHTEAVSYIAGRADLLVLFFILVFIIVYTKMVLTRSRGKLISLLMLLYCCALCSKEIAVILPILVIIWHIFFYRRKGLVSFWYSLVGMGCITLVYFVLRAPHMVMQRFDIYSFTLIERCAVAIKAFSLYCVIIVAPLALHMEHLILPPANIFDAAFLAALLCVVLFVGILVSVVRHSRSGAVGLLWFLVALLPVLNFVPINATFSEHWLYIPLVGVSLAIGTSLRYGERIVNKNILMGVVILFIMFFSARTIIRNQDWRDPIRFYEQTLRYSPKNIKILFNLGNAYLREKKADAAIHYYDEIIRIVKENTLVTEGDGAEVLLRRLLTKTYNNMGNAYSLKHEYEQAITYYKQSIKISAQHELSHLNLAMAYYQLGQMESARKQYAIVLRLNPLNEKARLYLNNIPQ